MTAEWFDVVYTKFCVIRSGEAGVLLLTFDAGASGAKQSVVVPRLGCGLNARIVWITLRGEPPHQGWQTLDNLWVGRGDHWL